MDDSNDYLFSMLTFLEFKQNILFLKPPEHKVEIFCSMTLDDFKRIKQFVDEYSFKIKNSQNFSLYNFSQQLSSIWEPAKLYPIASNLIAKLLMDENIYNKLLSHK